MANIAYTEHYFQGSEKNLEKLKGIFESFDKNPDNRALFNLARELGINCDSINIRGYVEDWHCNENDGNIFLITSSAWDSCIEFFYRINEKFFNDELSISYRVEESGCEIYHVHDEGLFFPERFYVSAYYNDEIDSYDDDPIEGEYLTMGEIFDAWCGIIKKSPKEFGENLTDRKMMDIIDEYEDYKSENTYFNVYEFQEV